MFPPTSRSAFFWNAAISSSFFRSFFYLGTSCLLLCHVLQSSHLPSWFSLSVPSWLIYMLNSTSLASSFTLCVCFVMFYRCNGLRTVTKLLGLRSSPASKWERPGKLWNPGQESGSNWNKFMVWEHLPSVYCPACLLCDASICPDVFGCLWPCLENCLTAPWTSATTRWPLP